MATETNVFSKKHEEVMAQDKKAILEEMNLPPAMITFIRKNSRNIKIAIAVLVVSVIVWEGYGEYSLRQQEKSSSLLFTAVNTDNSDEKNMLLGEIIKEYSSSKSAIWAQLELGHLAFQNNDYQGAIDRYQEVAQKISKDNSLYPLVQYSLAQAFDSLGDSPKSVAAYQELLNFAGFAAEGYLGLGRLYEKSGDISQSLEMYESYISLPGINESASKEMVQSKINKLKNNK